MELVLARLRCPSEARCRRSHNLAHRTGKRRALCVADYDVEVVEGAEQRTPYIEVGLVAEEPRHLDEFGERRQSRDGCGPSVAHQAEPLYRLELLQILRERLQKLRRISHAVKSVSAFVKERPFDRSR